MSVSLEVSKREVHPRPLRNKLRREGKVPAVVYGHKVGSTPISLDGLTLSRLLHEHGANTAITIDIDGQKVNILIHKTQANTFTSRFGYAEFLSVNMSEETGVGAEIVPVDKSIDAKSGGVLAQNLCIVVVSTTPDKLPKQIEVGVTNLELGDSTIVADLPRNDDCKFATDSEGQIATVVAQSEEEESTGEGGESEVIGLKEE